MEAGRSPPYAHDNVLTADDHESCLILYLSAHLFFTSFVSNVCGPKQILLPSKQFGFWPSKTRIQPTLAPFKSTCLRALLLFRYRFRWFHGSLFLHTLLRSMAKEAFSLSTVPGSIGLHRRLYSLGASTQVWGDP